MPKKYGVKEKDLVVSHVVDMVLTGRLRSGDRLDRNEIAQELGLSRVPVQEAVVQLEHDGILSTRYHRGAFVERFDEATVREHHELYGLLTAIASARAAVAADPLIAAELDDALEHMRNGKGLHAFDEHARRFRAVVAAEYAGPRLQAAIHSSQTLFPPVFWAGYLDCRDECHDALLPSYEDELAAIRASEPAAARTACMQRSDAMAGILLAELVRRGVLRPAAPD